MEAGAGDGWWGWQETVDGATTSPGAARGQASGERGTLRHTPAASVSNDPAVI